MVPCNNPRAETGLFLSSSASLRKFVSLKKKTDLRSTWKGILVIRYLKIAINDSQRARYESLIQIYNRGLLNNQEIKIYKLLFLGLKFKWCCIELYWHSLKYLVDIKSWWHCLENVPVTRSRPSKTWVTLRRHSGNTI